MLKAQLKSKIFQIDTKWQGIEDILTGDFFGILDYLPRKPYLKEFFSYLTDLNSATNTPTIDDVDWNSIQIIFWPLRYTEDENAEPDVVIISNKWVLVIEVKLKSGLGDSQPWREYVVGQQIAIGEGLSKRHVYYLVLTKDTVNIAQSFESSEAENLKKLSRKTSYLKWHEVVTLVGSWLKYGVKNHGMKAEHRRMLDDLLSALKRRRSLAFSGFKFANLGQVDFLNEQLFCPPLFTKFLLDIPEVNCPYEDKVFLSLFNGFLKSCLPVKKNQEKIFLQRDYKGFLVESPNTKKIKHGAIFCSAFDGFAKNTPACEKQKYILMKGHIS